MRPNFLSYGRCETASDSRLVVTPRGRRSSPRRSCPFRKPTKGSGDGTAREQGGDDTATTNMAGMKGPNATYEFLVPTVRSAALVAYLGRPALLPSHAGRHRVGGRFRTRAAARRSRHVRVDIDLLERGRNQGAAAIEGLGTLREALRMPLQSASAKGQLAGARRTLPCMRPSALLAAVSAENRFQFRGGAKERGWRGLGSGLVCDQAPLPVSVGSRWDVSVSAVAPVRRLHGGGGCYGQLSRTLGAVGSAGTILGRSVVGRCVRCLAV